MEPGEVAAELGLSPHVAEFFLRVAYNTTPPDVVKTLDAMDPQSLKTLAEITQQFQQAGGTTTAYFMLPFGVH